MFHIVSHISNGESPVEERCRISFIRDDYDLNNSLSSVCSLSDPCVVFYPGLQFLFLMALKADVFGVLFFFSMLLKTGQWPNRIKNLFKHCPFGR